MKNNDIYDDQMMVTCTDTGKSVSTLVAEFNPGKLVTCYLAKNKIAMYYNQKHNQYQASLSGMEFVTSGPKLLGKYR
jgi:hypothetical protein